MVAMACLYRQSRKEVGLMWRLVWNGQIERRETPLWESSGVMGLNAIEIVYQMAGMMVLDFPGLVERLPMEGHCFQGKTVQSPVVRLVYSN
jgi:hypothetical protein